MSELVEIVKDIRTIITVFGSAWCIVTILRFAEKATKNKDDVR